jgi:hypothetical protein
MGLSLVLDVQVHFAMSQKIDEKANGSGWVKTLSTCGVDQLFEALKLQVQEDVDTRNNLTGQSIKMFKVIVEGNAFAVFLVAPGVSGHGVQFTLTDTAIRVSDGGGATILEGTPALNDAGECRLKVNGQERELWQFRKDCLESLFFHDPLMTSDPGKES